jgi:hypothetical protein
MTNDLKSCPFGCPSKPHEFKSWLVEKVTCYGNGGRAHQPFTMTRNAWNTRALSQTLPAPGEVEAAASETVTVAPKPVRYAAIGEASTVGPRWYIWKSGTSGNYVAGNIADEASAKAIAAALTTLATVAAANDEGVADDRGWVRQEAHVRGWRHGLEDAAKLAEAYLTTEADGDHQKHGRTLAVAIRLLSQNARHEGWTEKGHEWLDAGAPLATSRSQHEGAGR